MNNITNKETAIVICSYKNRTDILFKYLNEYEDFDIYIVVRDYDYIESGYDKYEFNDNIKFIKLPNLHTITDTRYYAQQEMIKLGYRAMIMIDDDIKGKFVYRISQDKKRTTSDTYGADKKSLPYMFNEMIEKANEYDAAFVGVMFGNTIGFSKPDRIKVNRGLTCCACTFHNLDYCKKYDIYYDIDNQHILEDLDVVIQYMMHGLNCITLQYYGIFTNFNTDLSTVVDNVTGYDKLIINTYLKYRDYVTLWVKKSGILGIKTNWKIVYNAIENNLGKQFIIDDEYHNKMFLYCNNYDINNLVELIKHKNDYGKKRTKKGT